ncbi:MAG: thiolase family protein [Legionellaceae bacterium]|nr:thiolase family protein [Legionellaceae bacterium]
MNHDIVIVAAKRTPIGNLLGSLSTLTAPQLAAHTLQACLAEANMSPEPIDEVILGCVLSAGIGQAPARQATLHAGLPNSTPATTLNKMCGSGMKAIIQATDSLRAESANIILAGGMESMSNAPYLLAKARKGYRLGHGTLQDHLFLDGLEDAYEPGKPMGAFAEISAHTQHISREEQDAFAHQSLERSLEAQTQGYFRNEIAPIPLSQTTEIQQDENPSADKLEKISRLKPIFQADGSITAASSSSISDGAATLLIMTSAEAQRRGCTPLARIVAHATHAQAPAEFCLAPISAIQKVLHKANWKASEVDLFEINEAFAVVALLAMKSLHLPLEKVNIHGGACALGHPIGASGARIVVTLLHALRRLHKKRGVASLCIGGGEATALAIECF